MVEDERKRVFSIMLKICVKCKFVFKAHDTTPEAEIHQGSHGSLCTTLLYWPCLVTYSIRNFNLVHHHSNKLYKNNKEVKTNVSFITILIDSIYKYQLFSADPVFRCSLLQSFGGRFAVVRLHQCCSSTRVIQM